MSAESHDALQLFRSALASSLPPTLLTAASEPAPSLRLAAYISFAQSTSEPINLVKDYATRYAKSDTKDGFYTAAQIYLAWSERASAVRDYLIKGQAEGVGYVSVTDRRFVLDYLNGGNDEQGRVVPLSNDAGPGSSMTLPSGADALPASLESEAGPSKVSQPAKRKYEVNRADLEFCKKLRSEVVELRDRNSVLRASQGGKVHSFESFVKGVMAEKIRALRKSMEAPSGRGVAPQSQASTDPSRGPRKAKQSNPIIMISSSPTALITMWNVRRFLEQGIFEPSDVARQREMSQGNVKSEDMIPIMRKKSGPAGDITSKYYVVDGVEALQKFGQDAWDRVICVLTTGQAWQFRPYKWQDPKTLFRHVKGVYFQWSNDPTNPAVRDWNVQELRIDRLKRHLDQQVVADFWRSLESVKRR
ncbi:RNA pol II accessory factor, Cdc73 family-domain-containing protein [Kockovaella imperatae]|uniref:RNA pol II accessory factor, Cdc73 family-domain-containing protein n=1 Tax=Kockovaella imperatae TaxID=4999 RepID=A0A1Y1UK75_9TREE|nr:RNA pol II accessory factor, Cdc73 family-domain-containing protein [Kockovaella imperatae]XP_021871853.1 RNA pol II accessory factor, Cdc73 family-domain-containing protein [Kockovaella imperatae]ORX33232.1 RNA pol II accessory factor, Cdc73 family-domain-containing protein [Kockovaella imperatae]ORX37866.1 RNA pol II accessory factor, Cdc73 family-domain-containing protein [Kockovaella imperatae]